MSRPALPSIPGSSLDADVPVASPTVLRLGEPGYPASLTRLTRPPATLHLLGSLDGLARAVAIVGTRRATPDALAVAHALAYDLARAGWVVVSGGAEGVDRAAHDGALAHPSGRTLAFLPTPLDRPFPTMHRSLFATIAGRGGCLSEIAPTEATRTAHFLERNRLIAAVACALVVVQAPSRSGALSTAAHARKLGVPSLAVPWSPREPMGEGTNELLARGALLCRGASDVLLALGAEPPARAPRKRASAPRDPDERAVLAAIDDRATDVDTLAVRCGFSVARTMSAVIRLTIEGRVHDDARGLRRA